MPYRDVCADKVYFVALGPNYSLRAEALIERSSEPLGRNRYRTLIATVILTQDIAQLCRNGYRRNLRDTAQCL